MKKIFNKLFEIYKNHKEGINYLIFGGLTTLLSLIVYYALTWTIINPKNPLQLQIANILSWVCGFLFAYFTNRKFVFESKNKRVLKEFFSFFLSRLSTLFLDMLIMFIFVTLLKYNDAIFKIVSQALVIISNYALSKIFVFKNKKNRSDL